MPLLRNSPLVLALLIAMPGCKRVSDQGSAPTQAAAPASAAAVAKTTFDIGELDTTGSACQNLDTFVNAKWNNANPIPPDQPSSGIFNQLLDNSGLTQRAILEAAAREPDRQTNPVARKLGLLYAAGMDDAAIQAAGYQPIESQLTEIATLKSSKDVADYISRRHAEGDGQVFKFGAGADLRDARRQIAFASEGGLGLPSKEYYTASKHASIREAYLAYMAESFMLTGSNAETARAQAKDVLALETRLAAASLSPTDAGQSQKGGHFVSVADADKITPHFSWKEFLATQGVDVGDGFSLSQPRFFAEFDRQLATAPIAQWRAYLRLHTISAASDSLSKAFVDNHFAFYGKTLAGMPQPEPRWKQVMSAVNDAMGEGLGQLYVAKTFTPEAKQRATEMAENIRIALRTRIENLDWMSAETKTRALAKWATLLPRMGYPDVWRDWSALEIVPGAYYRNLQAAAKFNYRHDIAQIGKPTDPKRWDMLPQTVNAYYNPKTNTLTFPAAILQPPLFDTRADDALNYGGIGLIIGHEATHGFDDEGSQLDGAGNVVDWWTAQDRKAFEQRAGRLVEQFDAYIPLPSRPTVRVDGRRVLNENIGDLGGLNIAYDALQRSLRQHPERAATIDGYRPEQRFFLAFARIWRGQVREQTQLATLAKAPQAPRNLRAIAAPSNMPQFSAAFSCKAGDAMVRAEQDRVVIW
ncbi:M13 family metallopeptidase [Xanthomonas campestris pv. asclepiadis]|uniref:M13 family metallopeptidase n=1 Tax=Xanthomonas campestris TaxID=339 RepID=UPI001E3FD47D|nr:M13 family metallopeptidase [Xanthomonas campestris]MCC4615535.1 M13 family metallopeptidase [Xanthomonas campestris pv. asclepiadis]